LIYQATNSQAREPLPTCPSQELDTCPIQQKN
jgi:hypothetical protein